MLKDEDIPIAFDAPAEPTFWPYVANTDGGCRGNPGPAAWSWVLRKMDENGFQTGHEIGYGLMKCASNNEAEYQAVIELLEHAIAHQYKPLLIRMDSELIMKQLNAEYQVHSEVMKPYYERAAELMATVGHVKIEHVKREFNSAADHLCNFCMDVNNVPRQKLKRKPKVEENEVVEA